MTSKEIIEKLIACVDECVDRETDLIPRDQVKEIYEFLDVLYTNYANSVTQIVKSSKPLEPEFSKVVEENFWDLV